MIDMKRLNNGEKICFKNKEVSGYITKKVRRMLSYDDIYYAIVLFDRNKSKWDIHILEKDDIDVVCHYYPSAQAYIACGYDVEKRTVDVAYDTVLDAVTNGTWDYSKYNKTPPPIFDDDTITFIKETVKELQNEYRKGSV